MIRKYYSILIVFSWIICYKISFVYGIETDTTLCFIDYSSLIIDFKNDTTIISSNNNNNAFANQIDLNFSTVSCNNMLHFSVILNLDLLINIFDTDGM